MMRFSINPFFISLFLLCAVETFAQEQQVTIEDFIEEHQGFEENEAGEITPINIKEINKKIRFFVEERYPEIVEYTRNIIWDSYKTFLSPSNIYHYHTFIAQVKVNDLERLKYVEVVYNPFIKKVKGDFEWIPEDEEFYLIDEKEEKKDNAPDLIELGVSNQEQKADGGPFDMIHTENFILVDPESRIRGFYDGTDLNEIDRLLEELDWLMEEYFPS
jgi:hypothetical protein